MFYVVRDDADLVALLNQPMARWRVFLHPSQRRVALKQSYSGPARVMGGAGTGKTVVLLHRARFLAERETGSARRILVTTFTRNLATDLSRSLADLAGAQVMDRVEVTTVDALAHRIIRENRGVQVNACRDVEELRLFEEAVRASGCDLVPEVVRQEWRQVILAQDLTTRDAYFTAPRPGRGVRVSRSDRAAIWKACEEVQRLLGSRRTFLQLANEAAHILAVIPSPPYNHILVDEAQDLHPAQWRLIRAAARVGPDDLFIAGDTHQRIYGNRITLGSLGIDVRGRSARLTLNYRTTHEILRWSLGILRGQAFDDLDDGSVTLAGYRSTMHGPAPTGGLRHRGSRAGCHGACGGGVAGQRPRSRRGRRLRADKGDVRQSARSARARRAACRRDRRRHGQLPRFDCRRGHHAPDEGARVPSCGGTRCERRPDAARARGDADHRGPPRARA